MFRQVVEGRPEQNDIEHASVKLEGLIEKPFDIPDRIAVVIRTCLPVHGAGVVDHIGKKDAVAEAGEVVDIGGRRVPVVDDAQAGLGLQALAHRCPGA